MIGTKARLRSRAYFFAHDKIARMPAFTYGWGEKGTSEGPFWIRFDRCTRKPDTWKEEIYRAARSVAASTTKPLWLCSSGGIDSEVMCRAFHDQNIPFSVLTLRHMGGTNMYDIRFAVEWCKARGVQHEIRDIDMVAFLTKGMDRFVQDGYPTEKPLHYMKMLMFEMIDEMGGFGVIGSGEQRYIVDPAIEKPTPQDVHLDLGVGYIASVEWCRRNNRMHEPFFMHHTAELNLAFLEDPFVEFALRNPAPFRSLFNRFYIKQFVYHTVWLDLVPRVKYTGFEGVSAISIPAMERLRRIFGARIQSAKIPIPMLLDQLRPLPA
jgi:hypothetical protein